MMKRHNLQLVSMTQLAIFSLSPAVDFPFGRKCKAMLASRVNGNFLDENVLQ
jgi:hypothetical protein